MEGLRLRSAYINNQMEIRWDMKVDHARDLGVRGGSGLIPGLIN